MQDEQFLCVCVLLKVQYVRIRKCSFTKTPVAVKSTAVSILLLAPAHVLALHGHEQASWAVMPKCNTHETEHD